MSDEKAVDRRSDVGGKMFVGVLTAVLSAIFLGTLGMSVRAVEMNYLQDTRLSLLEGFASRQDKLNEKLEKMADRLLIPEVRR